MGIPAESHPRLRTMTDMITYTQFFVALTGLLTAFSGIVLGVVKFWMNRTRRQLQMDLHAVLESHGARIMRQIDGVDPNTYVTLDFKQANGRSDLAIPLLRDRAVEPITGLFLTLEAIFPDRTEYQVSTREHPVPVRLPLHSHSGTESVTVIRGTLLDVATGRSYTEGETWHIEPGKNHSAEFYRCIALAIMRPPLPLASVRPANLDAIRSVYDDQPSNTQ
jgi:hypothetical protein